MARHIDNVWFFGLLLALFLRWTTSQFSYSGENQPPMYGDYEAQRHWMEVTVNLDVKQWYSNTSDNDLLYWGLDYPPLTAYHSFVNGKIAQYFNKSWVQLFDSRGIESYYHKLFMRSTVVVIDLVIYFTSILCYWITASDLKSQRDQAIATVLTLIYPGLILIDHGHFQYNCVSLGLTVWAIILLSKGHDILGSIAYSLALNYKQMALYYSFPFFCFLLGKVLLLPSLTQKISKFSSLAFTVILTFILCWLPYISDYESSIQVIRRLFPLDRGIYEDKVANLWCSISVILKLKNWFSQSTLAMISAVVTLLALIPSNVHLLFNPNIKSFKYSLASSSLVFFLLSFQVHEKTILFSAIPILLLIEDHSLFTLWFVIISTFSLQPLITKDGLILPYFALTIFYILAFYNSYSDLKVFKLMNSYLFSHSPFGRKFKIEFKEIVVYQMFLASMIFTLVLSIAAVTIEPPQRFPDIHSLANAIFCFIHFVCFTIVLCNFQIFKQKIKKN